MIRSNLDPIISNIRTGKQGNEFLELNESLIVDASGKVHLKEKPNEYRRVIVKDENNNYLNEEKEGIPSLTGFVVDYEHSNVTFNIAHIGKTFHFEYYGEGLSYFPATSIYTERDGLTVVETLDSLTNRARVQADRAEEQADRAETELDNTQYRGAYNSTTQYHKNNIISFNGSSFKAKKDTIGNPPPVNIGDVENEWWGLTSRKGTDSDVIVETFVDKFTATQGQTVFQLNKNYDQFRNRTEVLINGYPQDTPENYIESGQNEITFTEPLEAGMQVTVRYFGEALPSSSNLEAIVSQHTEQINDLLSNGAGGNPPFTQTFTSTANQTVFNLSRSYVMGNGRLAVFIEGIEQFSPTNFTETNTSRFTLTEALPAGLEVVAKIYS